MPDSNSKCYLDPMKSISKILIQQNFESTQCVSEKCMVKKKFVCNFLSKIFMVKKIGWVQNKPSFCSASCNEIHARINCKTKIH